jgi:hypothetical protein
MPMTSPFLSGAGAEPTSGDRWECWDITGYIVGINNGYLMDNYFDLTNENENFSWDVMGM